MTRMCESERCRIGGAWTNFDHVRQSGTKSRTFFSSFVVSAERAKTTTMLRFPKSGNHESRLVEQKKSMLQNDLILGQVCPRIDSRILGVRIDSALSKNPFCFGERNYHRVTDWDKRVQWNSKRGDTVRKLNQNSTSNGIFRICWVGNPVPIGDLDDDEIAIFPAGNNRNRFPQVSKGFLKWYPCTLEFACCDK